MESKSARKPSPEAFTGAAVPCGHTHAGPGRASSLASGAGVGAGAAGANANGLDLDGWCRADGPAHVRGCVPP